MRLLLRGPRWLIACILAVIGFAAVPAAPPAMATGPNDWAAWHLNVDFPNNTPRVIYTFYTATGDPGSVVTWMQQDVTSQCQIKGTFSYNAGYAIFDGKTTYLRCRLPPKPVSITSCGKGSFWTAADLRLRGKALTNPIFEGLENGNRVFSVGAPSNGTTAQTQVRLNSMLYTTPSWTQNSWMTGNRFMLGSNGPNLVQIADYFELQGLGWLNYMVGWEPSYDATVTPGKLRHLVQSPNATWTVNAGNYWVHPEFVYIGYSPATGKYFEGGLREAEIDPPGCYGG
jgi:hypothetical protein